MRLKAFTLVETITVLLVSGVIITIAGMFLFNTTKIMTLNRTNKNAWMEVRELSFILKHDCFRCSRMEIVDGDLVFYETDSISSSLLFYNDSLVYTRTGIYRPFPFSGLINNAHTLSGTDLVLDQLQFSAFINGQSIPVTLVKNYPVDVRMEYRVVDR